MPGEMTAAGIKGGRERGLNGSKAPTIHSTAAPRRSTAHQVDVERANQMSGRVVISNCLTDSAFSVLRRLLRCEVRESILVVLVSYVLRMSRIRSSRLAVFAGRFFLLEGELNVGSPGWIRPQSTQTRVVGLCWSELAP